MNSWFLDRNTKKRLIEMMERIAERNRRNRLDREHPDYEGA